ncbi:MAG: triosephosphate isomerase, partial [Bacteroidetes bacterium]|nr:triosephosphate isomerase [Bacteroidota bacterium]
VGETLAQREAGETTRMVEAQVRGSLAHFPADHLEELVIAYEPVWAIGTGKVATPKQANEVHHQIRKLLVTLFGQAGSSIRVIYGGSVKPENAAALFMQADIDGGLIGGASLKARDFIDIVKAMR